MISPAGDTITILQVQLSEITTQLEQANEKIKKIESRLEPGPDLVGFDTIYDKHVEKLLKQKEHVLREDKYFSLRTIDDASREWKNYNEEISQWKEKVNARIKTLETDLFETEVLEKTWELTIKKAGEGGVPGDVLTTVTAFRSKLKVVRKELIKSQTEALRKQNNLTEISLIVDDVLTYLENTRKTVQSEFFRQDSPPIWKSADSTAKLDNIKTQIVYSVNENIQSLTHFYETNRSTFILHIIIFLVLWLLYYLLYVQARKLDPEHQIEEFDKARTVISHYGMSALIVALFLTIWLYPTIVTSVTELVQLAYIIIALFFLPKFVDKRLRQLLIPILILFLINEIHLFFYARVFFVRVMLILENILAGWILYKIIAKGSYIALELKKHKWTILLRMIPIFIIFLIASFIGNIIGFVDLSILLGNTVVNALFNLIILILAIMVVNRTIAILLRTPFMQSSFVVRNHLNEIEKRLIQIIKIVAVLLWIKSVLKLLGIYTMFYNWLTVSVQTKWEIGDNSTIELSNIINFILVIFITIIIYRLSKVILKEDIFPRVILPRGIPGTINTVVTYLIVGYGFVIAIGAAGVDLSEFGLMAGALGVGIGFGLQGIVANFIAGLVLAFERPIQVGDEIQMSTQMGVVLSIGVRSTTIRTYDGSEVIIPNSDLITKEVINWTLTDRKKRRDIIVTVAYGSNPEEVLELIRKVANEHPDVLKIPAPWALFDGFGDSSLNFRIRIWTLMDNGMTVRSAVAVKIYAALKDAGIVIPFPQHDLHIKSIEPQFKESLSKPGKAPVKRKNTKPKTEPGDKRENDELETTQ